MSKPEWPVAITRNEAARVAEQRLGRKLTAPELAGLESIKSGKMLEAIYRSFAYSGYTAEQVAEDLSIFAGNATKLL